MTERKIEICKLFQRTSDRGTTYAFGRLGSARIIAFANRDGDLPYGAEAVWTIYVQEPEKRPADAQAQRRAPARRRPRTEPADAGEPLPDDGVEDLWR